MRAEDGTDAGIDHGPRRVVPEVVHVREGGRTALQHLYGREERAPVDELGIDQCGLGREDVVVQPAHEGHIVGESPEERHRGVAVGVDEPRDDQVARRVEDRHTRRPGVRFVQQAGDRVPFHEHGASLEDGAGLVHDHHRPAVDQ